MKTTGYPIKNAILNARQAGPARARARIRKIYAMHLCYEPVFYDTPAALCSHAKVRQHSKLYSGTQQLTLVKKSGARAGKTPKSHRLSSNCKSKMQEGKSKGGDAQNS